MSATYPLRKAAPARPRRAAAPARPRLVVIASPNRRTVARGPFMLLVGGLLLGGLLALLMLHTLAAQDAFRQTSLQQQLGTLTDTEQQLEQQVQMDSAPAALEARARALGMVPSTITGYHQGPNGRTVAHEVPVVTYVAPTASATSSTSATSQTASTDSTDSTSVSQQPSAAHHKHPGRP